MSLIYGPLQKYAGRHTRKLGRLTAPFIIERGKSREGTFKVIFGAGLAAIIGCLVYVVFEPMTEVIEIVGLFAGVVALIGAAGLLYFWIPQAFDLEKARQLATATSQYAIAGAQQLKLKVATHLKPVHWAVIACVIAVGAVSWVKFKASQQAEADRASLHYHVRSQCAEWIGDEFNTGWNKDKTKVSGSWLKNGHIVVEVAWKDEFNSKSWRSRLCVYNLETGQMQSPGAFGRQRWEQY